MNISDTPNPTNKYNWLAERNGIAIAKVNQQLELILNSHAMLIFGIDKSHIQFSNLKGLIDDSEKFKLFLTNISNETSEFDLSITHNNVQKKYLVYGINDSDNEWVNVTIQPLNTDHKNAEFLCQYAIHSQDVFAICNTESQLLYVNQNFETLFERNRNELLNNANTIFDWVAPEDIARVTKLNCQSDNVNTEFRVLMPNGTKKWIWHIRKALYDGEGVPFRHLGVFTDITKRKEVEEQLIVSKTSFEQNHNPIYWFDENANIKYTNQAACDMLGYSLDELITKKVYEFNEDISEDQWKNQWVSLKKDRILSRQTYHIKKDGTKVPVEVDTNFLDLEEKEYVFAFVRDISERIKTQKLLKENVANYKMIVEGQSELIVKLDESWKILFASPSFEKVFEQKGKLSIGQNFLDFASIDEKELVGIAMEKMLNPPYSCFFEFNAQTNTGTRWFAWNYTGVKDKEGKVKDFIGVGRDITYQKMVESALRESEDRFRSIVQNLSDVVFLIDEKANIKYVTPSCEQYLGVGVEELLGNNVINLIHNDDKWLAEENIALHIEGSDYSMPYEIRLKHKSNTWRIFEAKSQNLLNHSAVNSIIFTISDVTERKQMEKQVLDAIIKTEEKERERFAKDLHDDLGPLLSSIKMYIGMLKKVDKKEKQEFIINNLQEIVKEAITTTKDVSNDLNPHVLNNYGLISALKLFIDKISEELNIEFIEEIGDARYSAAIELSLYRITKELINNTIKHAEATQIKINIGEKGSSLNLMFEDNGKGLPEGAFKVKKPGGMGLSNIISRAKSLNAKHSFHTNLKSGFIFEMQVPLVQE